MNYLLESLIVGLFCVTIYAFVVRFVPVSYYLHQIGVVNRWIALITMLFVFGFEKHVIGYYSGWETAYCNHGDQCSHILLPKTENTYFLGAEKYISLATNIWAEAFGEGLVFVLIGIPVVLLIPNGYIAAFAIGIIAHILAELVGIHAYFCKYNCKAK